MGVLHRLSGRRSKAIAAVSIGTSKRTSERPESEPAGLMDVFALR